MSDLQRLVKSRMAELQLSYRRAAEKSGGLVSHATLNNIATGRHTYRLDATTVQGIAAALDLDEATVQAAVGRASRAESTEFVLPKRANRLTAQERRAIVSMVDALLTAAESGVERTTFDDVG